MNLKDLEQVIDPPTSPSEVPPTDSWVGFQKRVTNLPLDYKLFIQRYGTGSIDSFIWIFNPASQNPHLNLECQITIQKIALTEFDESLASMSILPCGITENGDTIFWETKNEPELWTIAVLASRSKTLLRFEVNLTTFLHSILAGKLRCSAFPEDFPSQKPSFTSVNRMAG